MSQPLVADSAPAGAGELWTLFSTAVAGKPDELADFFLLPPSAGSAAQVAGASEEVRFLRDETANLLWAVEETTEKGIGEPWPGRERDEARRAARGERPPVTTNGGTDGAPPLRYLIQTPVPESWIPFLPVLIDPATGSIRLERSFMERESVGDDVVLPLGRILRPTNLKPGDPYQVFEEEVPREGTRVSRHFVRSRWTDGSTHLWIARRKASGARGQAGCDSTSRFRRVVRRTRHDRTPLLGGVGGKRTSAHGLAVDHAPLVVAQTGLVIHRLDTRRRE